MWVEEKTKTVSDEAENSKKLMSTFNVTAINGAVLIEEFGEFGIGTLGRQIAHENPRSHHFGPI